MDTYQSPPVAGLRRVVGVGTSRSLDAAEAGREAARAAVDSAGGGDELVLAVVYASSAYDLDTLAAVIDAELPGAQVIGCTTSGEIATSGPGDSGVVVFLLRGGGFSVRTASAPVLDGDVRTAAFEAAACIDGVERRANTVLLMLTDGLCGDQQEAVRGAFERVGATVPLVGGCAGDDLAMRRTHQIFGSTVTTETVLCAAISSDGPIGIGVRHGWRTVGEPFVVTQASGVTVHTLDDRPALDEYLRRLDAPEEVWRDPSAFTAFAATRPIGLSRRDRDEIRFVATADFEERSITCFAGVPEGAVVSVMEGDAASVMAAAEDACREALGELDGTPPIGLMAFDCIARRGVLGESIHQEINLLSSISDSPVAGFYTYGEIARTQGAGGFHNQTFRLPTCSPTRMWRCTGRSRPDAAAWCTSTDGCARSCGSAQSWNGRSPRA